MKIEKFSKNKDGMYLITLEDGNKIKIHEDLILKYELLLSKKLDFYFFAVILDILFNTSCTSSDFIASFADASVSFLPYTDSSTK